MDNGLDNKDFYVASAQSPEPRRPPITEVGLLRWIRDNLFNSPIDAVITIVTFLVVGLCVVGILNWIIFSAQWEVVFLNLRVYSLGLLFPQDQIWRVDLVIAIVVALTFLSVAVWGKLNRVVLGSVIAILIAMYAIPAFSTSVPKPSIYLWAQENLVRVLNFTADAGQSITFQVIPVLESDDFLVKNLNSAYYENNNRQAGTSFLAFNERSANVVSFGTVDPSLYDLNFRLVILNANGGVITTSDYTEGRQDSDFTFTWDAPNTGWYGVHVEYDEEAPGVGGAWIQVDNMQVFRSTVRGREEIATVYGDIPAPEVIGGFCNNCVTTTARTNMRFEGTRTLSEFFSLQLTPLIYETRDLFVQLVMIGAAAYIIGRVLMNVRIGTPDLIRGVETTLSMGGGFLILLYLGVQFTLFFSPGASFLNQLGFMIFATLILIAFFYALLQFVKSYQSDASRGLMILWLIAIPVMWIILTGIGSIDGVDNPRFPVINTQNYGGMLLTLLLSAVSIVLSFPLGVLLAIGRQSSLPIVSLFCTVFIEVVRGVPLITLLFFGRFILPFFGFGLGDVDLMVRTMVMLTLFTAAYMAEVVRGGLQIIPKGQVEAAQALGLSGFWTAIFITLPQALRAVIPAIMGQAVSLFKDTSLVFVIGLFEMLGTMNQVLGDAQTGYTLFTREGYLYVGVAYFLFAYIMADVSRRLERTGAGSIRRTNL